jgi:hypothetical protein
MGRFGHPPRPTDDERRSLGRSAAERGNQMGRMSKIPPLPRPALIPGLAPLRGEAAQRRHESDLTRATCARPVGLAERAGRTEGGDRQFRIVTFEAIEGGGIADAEVSV